MSKELTLNFEMDPIERLIKELETEKNEMAIIIGNYLLNKFAEDEPLKNAYKDRKVTLTDIYDYVFKSAQKAAGGEQQIAIKDDEVYGWVIHFIQDGADNDIQALKTGANSVTLTIEDEEELKAKAMEEFKAKELVNKFIYNQTIMQRSLFERSIIL